MRSAIQTTLLIFGVSFATHVFSQAGNCKLGTLPSIMFQAGSAKLKPTAMALLDNVAQQLKANPECKLKVTGYGSNNKNSQQLSWDHVEAVIRYLVDKQAIPESQFIFSYGEQGLAASVDLVATTEDGPSSAPAPHPQFPH